MAAPIWQWGAAETAAAIRDRKIRCVDAVAAAVDRLHAVNRSVNAVTVDLSKEALEQAERADATAASGVALGPLHGVPITIKENVDQRGEATPNGIPAFANLVAKEDSPVVRNLRRAGAIVIGRTNTPEFSYRWFTDNPLRGKTLNPWDATVTPGGSSGGAAASVALGIGAIAHGNDLGGSLRYPAYACGVVSIRPSFGRVPAYNPTAAEERPPTVQLMSAQGPICREVRDVRLALAAMAERDPRDPWWVPAPLEWPRPTAAIRIAVTAAPAGLPCDPAVRAAIDVAAGHLSDAGYAVEAIDPPAVDAVAECWRKLITTDSRVLSAEAFKKLGSADFNRSFGDMMAAVPEQNLDNYVRALGERTRLQRLWALFMEDHPLILAPVSQVPPFPQDADLQGANRVRQMLDEQALLYGVNLLGLPSVAVPTGLHGKVPIGVQIIGQRFREDMCLDAAAAIERQVGILPRRLWAATP